MLLIQKLYLNSGAENLLQFSKGMVTTFCLSISALSVFNIILFNAIFQNHKKSGFIKTEQRKGIPLATSYYLRFLVSLTINYICITVVLIFASFYWLTPNLGKYTVNLIYFPVLSLYFFGFVICVTTTFVVVLFKGAPAILILLLITLTTVVSPIISPLSGEINKKSIYNQDRVGEFYKTSEKLIYSGQSYQAFGGIQEDDNLLTKLNQNLNTLNKFLNVSETVPEVNFEDLSFYNPLKNQQNNHSKAYVNNLDIGIISYFENEQGELQNIFANTELGTKLDWFIEQCLKNQADLPKVSPETSINIQYYDRSTFLSGSTIEYDFQGFLKAIKPLFKNQQPELFDYLKNTYQKYVLDLETNGIETEDVIFRGKLSGSSWQEAIENPIWEEGLNLKVDQKNKAVYDLYLKVPGVVMVNSMLMSGMRSVYYIDNVYTGENANLSGFLKDAKTSNILNKINLLNHGLEIYINNLNNNQKIKWNKIVAGSILPIDVPKISATDANLLVTPTNQTVYWTKHKLKITQNYNHYVAITVYLIIATGFLLLGQYIFTRKNRQ
ncbi:hypothetical protein [Spiroplasma clarkii]|nr:hypothetical protein [Spiroplasma clarkii]